MRLPTVPDGPSVDARRPHADTSIRRTTRGDDDASVMRLVAREWQLLAGRSGRLILLSWCLDPARRARRHDRERRSAMVSCSASSSAVGLIPNASVAAVESTRNGFRNWY